jgi:hypothetical protein
MGADDIEARSIGAQNQVEDLDKHVAVGRQNIHSTVPPHETYEGHHRFDPEVTWSPEEERILVRKTDMRLLFWLCVMVRLQYSLFE